MEKKRDRFTPNVISLLNQLEGRFGDMRHAPVSLPIKVGTDLLLQCLLERRMDPAASRTLHINNDAIGPVCEINLHDGAHTYRFRIPNKIALTAQKRKWLKPRCPGSRKRSFVLSKKGVAKLGLAA